MTLKELFTIFSSIPDPSFRINLQDLLNFTPDEIIKYDISDDQKKYLLSYLNSLYQFATLSEEDPKRLKLHETDFQKLSNLIDNLQQYY